MTGESHLEAAAGGGGGLAEAYGEISGASSTNFTGLMTTPQQITGWPTPQTVLDPNGHVTLGNAGTGQIDITGTAPGLYEIHIGLRHTINAGSGLIIYEIFDFFSLIATSGQVDATGQLDWSFWYRPVFGAAGILVRMTADNDVLDVTPIANSVRVRRIAA